MSLFDLAIVSVQIVVKMTRQGQIYLAYYQINVKGDDTFVLVSGEYFKRCSFNAGIDCQDQIHIQAQADRKITCRRLNACSDQGKTGVSFFCQIFSQGSRDKCDQDRGYLIHTLRALNKRPRTRQMLRK